MTAEQTGVSTMLVMWTAPSPPSTDGYQVQITRGSTTTTVNVTVTSHTSVNNQYGVYSIQVRSLSRHFQSNEAPPEQVEITVRGKHDKINRKSIVCPGISWYSSINANHSYRYFTISYLYTVTHCHISHHHLDSA